MGNVFDDPFLFKIVVLAIGDEFVTQGHKGLNIDANNSFLY